MNNFRFLAKSLIHGALEWTGGPHRRRQQLGGSLIVLTYHSFCTEWPSGLFNSLPVHLFEKQLQFLKWNFEVVTLEQGIANIQSGIAGEKPFIALTIDDGFLDNYTHAWPLLKLYAVPATIFLATDFLDTGQPPWPTQLVEVLERTERLEMSCPISAKIITRSQKSAVVRRLMQMWRSLSPAERSLQLSELRKHLEVKAGHYNKALSWTQVREMHRNGIVFGSHTVYHSILPNVDTEVAARELVDSKKRLEEELLAPCNLFAYPDGKHDVRTNQLVKATGFIAAVTQDWGHNIDLTDPLRINRIEIPYHDPMPTFRKRVSLA